ncbi:LysR family transcriptional regulator [Ensifer sp. Root31]|uniref:LysR family transcriptional regulator n=1 Tax=Ensifer sp. Root31 TaxID=1736512 RepID=UPI000709FFEC|nr:LysR family transcriptional regulator [Ensifer sp. Root31]KQU88098.1 LysR family transcriptional regulator [Ensifer sp. Root31]
MDSLGALSAFVQAADASGFTEAGRKLGVSPSAVSKAIQRLEERLGAQLFYRSTRSITLTPEGAVFLERCRRILCEVEAAETELTQAQSVPKGKLRISLPSVGILFMPRFAEFKRLHPKIEIELDFSDRLVDVIDEGFDAVIRTGEQSDSRLMARKLGVYRKVIVGSPVYFRQAGLPIHPEDLTTHSCLIYRYPSTGKLDSWPLRRDGELVDVALTTSMVMNTLEPQISLAEQGLGIACLPDIAIQKQLEDGSLISVLDDYMGTCTILRVLWPSSRHISPKLRAFVDFVADKLLETATSRCR